MKRININEETGMALLEKGKKGVLKVVFSRLGIIILLLLVQIVALTVLLLQFSAYIHLFSGIMLVISVISVLYLLNSGLDPTIKITWLIIIMVMPIFGALLLLYTQCDIGHSLAKKRLASIMCKTKNSIAQDPDVMERMRTDAAESAALTTYLNLSGNFPAYDQTDVTYYPLGEHKFEAMLAELEAAKEFIFMEYFIVDEGLMWGKILEILARKAAAGVDVRVMYDGTCELSTLPRNYPERLKELGIQCRVFSPFTPFLSTHYNYRDHRKILVIDGHTAFTGGVNLADEYINHIDRFGHWKDTAVRLKGKAVQSFTLMFLQMWSIEEKDLEFDRYLRASDHCCANAAGYVVPFGDSPLDKYKVGERVYMDILNQSEHYVYIMTPYLILDVELESALKFAAERGVDVRVILPGIPDKKFPYMLAKTHYASLLDSGVRIFEYTPGFVHAKMFVSDDEKAVVGTINLDYRSLYHHFECASYLHGVSCIPEIRDDILETQNYCREVTHDTVKQEKPLWKLLGFVMKAIAPLM